MILWEGFCNMEILINRSCKSTNHKSHLEHTSEVVNHIKRQSTFLLGNICHALAMRRSPAVEEWFKSYMQFFHLMEINGINPTKDFRALLSDKYGPLTLTNEEYEEYK